MNNMMEYGNGWHIGLSALWAVHILAVVAFFVGVIFFVVLAAKTFSHAQLKAWAVWLMVIGAVACLLTISIMGHPWAIGMDGFGGGRMGFMGMSGGARMMGGASVDGAASSSDQAADEAKGKALYDNLRAGQTTCARLSQNDFELIGEYAMGQGLGENHEQMNQMMQRMMGAQGEEQMHVLMGKQATGCTAALRT